MVICPPDAKPVSAEDQPIVDGLACHTHAACQNRRVSSEPLVTAVLGLSADMLSGLFSLEIDIHECKI